jgi:hypothetical protein
LVWYERETGLLLKAQEAQSRVQSG